MHRISTIALAGLASGFLLSASAHADPFDPKTVPADAKMVFHIDMDTARATKVWDAIEKKLESNPEFQTKLTEVQTITGMQFPQDLHDATIFSSSAQPDAGAVLIHAKIDKTKTMTAMQLNPSYASVAFGQYQVISWDDNGKKMFGAFHDDTHIVVGGSQDAIEGALNTLDAKAPAIALTSPLPAGAKPDLLLYVDAKDLPELKQNDQAAQLPIAGQLDTAWASLTENGTNEELQATVSCKTPDAAQQVQTTLEGIKSMISLSGGPDNPDPNAKNVAAALAALKTTVNGQTMTIDWPVSTDLVGQMLSQGAPATAPAAPGQ